MSKRIVFHGLILAACAIALSCTPPDAPLPTHYSITGHAYDGANGAPVFNATFRYGSAMTVTGADGAFSLDLGTAAGVRNEPMGFSAPGYRFMYVETARLDTADANVMTIRMKPLADTLYAVKDVQCKVYNSVGTEIATASRVYLVILPMNGIPATYTTTTYDAGRSCYFFSTRIHSGVCLVEVLVQMPVPAQSFFLYKTAVNLNAAEPINLRFDQPVTGSSDISLTVDTTACTASGLYLTPYGLLPILATYSDGGITSSGSSIPFTSGTTKTVSVYNPEGWQGFWTQQLLDTTTYPANMKVFMATSAIAAPSATVVIPAMDMGRGPTVVPDTGTWAYNAATGALSIDAVTGTQLYQYTVFDGSALTLGTIVSFTNSAVLPAWVNAIVADDSPRTMDLILMDTDLVGYSLDMVNRDTYPPAARFGAMLSAGGIPFSKAFTF